MDVVLSFITYNSYTKLKRTPITLEDVLNSTLQIPYKSVILVDDSSDETPQVFRKWVEEHGKELIVSKSKLHGFIHPTRATARQTAIDIFLENFRERWVMFVDDDVLLKEGWWRWVEENEVLSKPEVGEVWGVSWDVTTARDVFLKLLGLNLEKYLTQKFSERGGTHDTLYKREAIEGVRIPPELHVYEDAYLHYYVTCGGWVSLVNPVGVIHYHPISMYADLRKEKEKASAAIRTALSYGICEYGEFRNPEEGVWGAIRTYLSLIKPILGFLPMLLVTVKAYGLKAGFLEAVKRQELKFWYRRELLRYLRELKGIPEPCEVIKGRSGHLTPFRRLSTASGG